MVGRRRLVRTALLGLAAAATFLVPVDGAAAEASGRTVNLGTSDGGSAISVHVGDTINVQLKPDGQWRWSTPESSDSTILRRIDSASRSRHHHKITKARASFRVASTGDAALEAFGSLHCNKGHVCPALASAPTPLVARLWRVDVTAE